MKLLNISLMILLLSACMKNEMDKATKLWGNVLASENAAMEAESIKEVRKFIAEKNVTIVVNVINEAGQLVNINTLGDNNLFSAVQVTFDANNGEFQSPMWTPKDKENVFLLFLE